MQASTSGSRTTLPLRSVLATSSGRSAPLLSASRPLTSANGMLQVLQHRRQLALQVLVVVLVVVDPGLRLLVHRLAGDRVGRSTTATARAMRERRLADAGGGDLHGQLAAQQRAAEQPAPARQHGDVELVENTWARAATRPADPRPHAAGFGMFHFARPPVDHLRHLAAGLVDGVAGERQPLGGGQNLRVRPATRDPVAGEADQVVVPVIAGADAREAGFHRDAVELAADLQVRLRRRRWLRRSPAASAGLADAAGFGGNARASWPST